MLLQGLGHLESHYPLRRSRPPHSPLGLLLRWLRDRTLAAAPAAAEAGDAAQARAAGAAPGGAADGGAGGAGQQGNEGVATAGGGSTGQGQPAANASTKPPDSAATTPAPGPLSLEDVLTGSRPAQATSRSSSGG